MKILAFSSIRADYDLLSPLYKLLNNDSKIDFKILLSGAHLSHSFGNTQQYIYDDGLQVLASIETLINSDSNKSRLKSASLLLQNSIDIIDGYNPDLLMYAGDREDVIIYSLIGQYLQIPTIHFYGGDHEEDGHQDTYIRHATSKLSTYHFVSTEEHKNRLIALGEPTYRIFNIGSISLDKFNHFQKVNLASKYNLENLKNFALVIFHPIQNENSANIFNNILKVLKSKNIFSFVSFPNSDPGYEQIINVIEHYKEDQNFYFYKNLPRNDFLTIFNSCNFIIGNSSTGIYEAATIKKPAINVGQRQNNRHTTHNVIFIESDTQSISNTIDNISTNEFQNMIKDISNPYGNGYSSTQAYKLIKSIDFKKNLVKYEDPLKVNL